MTDPRRPDVEGLRKLSSSEIETSDLLALCDWVEHAEARVAELTLAVKDRDDLLSPNTDDREAARVWWRDGQPGLRDGIGYAESMRDVFAAGRASMRAERDQTRAEAKALSENVNTAWEKVERLRAAIRAHLDARPRDISATILGLSNALGEAGRGEPGRDEAEPNASQTVAAAGHLSPAEPSLPEGWHWDGDLDGGAFTDEDDENGQPSIAVYTNGIGQLAIDGDTYAPIPVVLAVLHRAGVLREGDDR